MKKLGYTRLHCESTWHLVLPAAVCDSIKQLPQHGAVEDTTAKNQPQDQHGNCGRRAEAMPATPCIYINVFSTVTGSHHLFLSKHKVCTGCDLSSHLNFCRSWEGSLS